MHNFNFSGKKILVVAGGTGGHIIPAIVFGRWLEAHGAIVTWLSDSRPLATAIYESHGIFPAAYAPASARLLQLSLEGSPLGVKRPRVIFKRSCHMLSSFRETAKFFKMTGTEMAFLFGGYVSFAPLIVARWRKIPVVMHEQNAIAGRVTRLASRMGATITTGWSECLGLNNRPFTHVGIPVREPKQLERGAALKSYGLDALAELIEHSDASATGAIKIIGVAGGSLGSKPLTEKLIAAAKNFRACTSSGANRVEFVLLGDTPTGQNKADLPDNLHFVGRQWNVNPLYSMCDVLVCRAGGSTLAEALVWKIPTVVVPWEGAAGGHQHENARCFIDAIKLAGSDGVLCPESISESDNASDASMTLTDAITRLLNCKRNIVNGRTNADFNAACQALANAVLS